MSYFDKAECELSICRACCQSDLNLADKPGINSNPVNNIVKLLASKISTPSQGSTRFVPGRSLSQFLPSGAVMQFSIGQGITRRVYDVTDIGVLADIGWKIMLIPEPSSFGMSLLALGVLGFGVRRKKAVV